MSPVTLLENNFGSLESFELEEGIEGVRFNHRLSCGEVSLYGGQVLGWQPSDHKPVFWLSKEAEYKEGAAIRGGIPLCWPWFGGTVKDDKQDLMKVSNHGFARNNPWQLTDYQINEDNVVLVLKLEGKDKSPHWPAQFSLIQTLIFSNSFEQHLEIINSSQQSVEYTGALHSYFCVGAPEETTVEALNGVKYDDKLTGSTGDISTLKSCKGPIDRVYHSASEQSIVDRKWQRKIIVSSNNCQQWVLWNPGVDANKMADMHAQAENEFVCLEAANTNWQVIQAGSRNIISQKISIASLN